MKSKFGFLAIIAIIAIIGFSTTACGGDGNDGDPGNGNGNPGNGNGNPGDLSLGDTITSTTTGMVLTYIPADTFTMGQEDISGATPHLVTLTRGFYMAKNPVTQAQYQAITGQSPSNFSGENLPVERVTWFDAVEFCNKLSIEDGLTSVYTITNREPESGYPITSATVTVTVPNWNANGYRLPTEAEWEFACRAGTTTPWSTGNSLSTSQANVGGGGISSTTPVGSYAANPWGLFDMHGNVIEWCWDFYEAYPGSGPRTDPVGAASGSNRVYRGGGWTNMAGGARSASRGNGSPDSLSYNLGFRVVRRP